MVDASVQIQFSFCSSVQDSESLTIEFYFGKIKVWYDLSYFDLLSIFTFSEEFYVLIFLTNVGVG